MSDETLRLAIGLILLGLVIVGFGFSLLFIENAARAAHTLPKETANVRRRP